MIHPSSRPASLRRVASILALATLSFVGCKSSTPAAPMTDARREQHVQSFEQVWTTIQKQHWDPALNGVDWEAARAELRPAIDTAKSDDEARATMTALLTKLKQSHFGIIPEDDYSGLDEVKKDVKESAKQPAEPTATKPAAEVAAKAPGSSGLHIRVVDDQALVIKVDPASAGEAAGVRPGWVLSRVGKVDVAEVLKRIRAVHAGSKLIHTYEALVVQSLLDGDAGDKIAARFLDDRNRKADKSLQLTTPAGTATKFGNLPTMFITAEEREVASNIGYVTFSAFFDPARVTKVVRTAVDRPTPYEGLVIDLRGNPGGIGVMANGIAGYLVDRPNLKLGEMIMRDSKYGFVITPQPVVYTGPLAVLVDECSMSTSEIMAGGLQDLGRARIFGTPTPGAALPSRIERLPNGDGFQYAFANYLSAKGGTLEGNGITPDETIKPSRKALLAGKDPALDAAIAWLQSQAKKAAEPATRPASISTAH